MGHSKAPGTPERESTPTANREIAAQAGVTDPKLASTAAADNPRSFKHPMRTEPIVFQSSRESPNEE